MRRLAGLDAALVPLALAAGCTAAPPPRAAPDAVERAAVADAQGSAERDGIPIAPDGWTQLWTPTQAAAKITACVYRGSGGVVEFRALPLAQQSAGLAYRVSTETDAPLRVNGDFDDQRALQ